MVKQPKYTMKLSLNVLNHLGLNLYSNVPAVLSEVVANAWDAEARNVEITIDSDNDRIEMIDDGYGMNLGDINDKYLNVGYMKRDVEGAISPNLKRHVMGRKGIGKLSLFSIANRIEIHSVKDGTKNGFLMTNAEIKRQIEENNGVYNPADIDVRRIKIAKGTKIILTGLKKRIKGADTDLRRRIARRFNIIGVRKDGSQTDSFQVKINGNSVTAQDRDYIKHIQFLWHIGDRKKEDFKVCKSLKEDMHFDGVLAGKEGHTISGWIGAVEKHGQLEEGNNAIVVMAWGKLIHEDMLSEYKEGGLYAKYLIGEITANFLDDDNLDDITTSNRQRVIEDDARYQSLKSYVYKLLKEIQGVWSEWRKKYATEKALKNPALKKWYESLPESSRDQAEKLFDKIESLPMDKDEDRGELYKYGILAFERLRVREGLANLDKLHSATDLRFAAIFNDLSDIEAVLYHDIATERVGVINAFAEVVDKHEKEKVIQLYLFKNLWLLHPSWERATENPRMEQTVTREFDKITAKLSKEEKAARYDIKYKTAAGKHIIIELKKAEIKIGTIQLVQQVKKYKDVLTKCLKDGGEATPVIEVICLLGHRLEEYEDAEFVKDQLRSVNARVIPYDQLLKESFDAYSRYLAEQKKVAKLKQIIDEIAAFEYESA